MTSSISRRAVLAGFGGATLGLQVPVATSQAATAEAEGFVFESEPGRRHRLPGDRGIAGVMVSNGSEVTLTRPDGSWRLPVRPDATIFVIKPPHFETLFGTGGIPHISCRHAATASAPLSISFPLISRPEPQAFQALLMTDTQPDCHEELDYVRDDIIAGLLNRPAAFGIHHGDVVGDALDLYPRYLDLLGATGMPWHHCAGNHDIDRDAIDDASSRETWQRTFGPRHYAFQYAGATFLILDNVAYLGRESGHYRGYLGPQQLQFVRNVLAHVNRDALVVVSMHIPLRCYLDPDNPADTTADYQDLLGLLEGRPHTVSFAGHLHATEHHYLPVPGDSAAQVHHHHVLTAGSGSWWSGPRDHRGIPCADSTDGTPNGFHVLSVDGHRYSTVFVPAAGKRIARLRAMVGAPVDVLTGADGPDRNHLVVNVFDGGPRTQVSCRFASQSDWTPLCRTTGRDPVVERLFHGSAPRKDWVQATPSSHIWQVPLPEDVRAGVHRVSLRVTDEYGNAHETCTVLEVKPKAT